MLEEEGFSLIEADKKEVRFFKWVKPLVITRRDFHDDWAKFLETLDKQPEESFTVNLFFP